MEEDPLVFTCPICYCKVDKVRSNHLRHLRWHDGMGHGLCLTMNRVESDEYREWYEQRVRVDWDD